MKTNKIKAALVTAIMTSSILMTTNTYGMYDPEGKLNQVSQHNGMKIQTLSAPVPGKYEAQDVHNDKGEVIGKTRAMPVTTSEKTGYVPQNVYDKEGNVVGQSRAIPVPISETEKLVSDNDLNLYKHIKNTLDEDYIELGDKYVKKTEVKTSKMSESVKKRYLDKFADKISELNGEFLSGYPQDIALPETANKVYLTLKFIELKIKIELVAGVEVK